SVWVLAKMSANRDAGNAQKQKYQIGLRPEQRKDERARSASVSKSRGRVKRGHSRLGNKTLDMRANCHWANCHWANFTGPISQAPNPSNSRPSCRLAQPRQHLEPSIAIGGYETDFLLKAANRSHRFGPDPPVGATWIEALRRQQALHLLHFRQGQD